MTRKELGLSTLDKLRITSGIRIGAQSIGHQMYIAGRVFAFLIGLKEPKFVVGYTGPEIDLALTRGEVDARAQSVGTVMQRSPELVEKGLGDFHAVLETPKGNRHPRFAHLPELESFAKSDKERRLLHLQRTLRLTGSTWISLRVHLRNRLRSCRKRFARPLKIRRFSTLTRRPPVRTRHP